MPSLARTVRSVSLSALLRWSLFVGLLLAFILVPFVVFEGQAQHMVERVLGSDASVDGDQPRARLITGIAELVTDYATQQEAFRRDNLLKHYLKSPDNPEFALYRIRPVQVRFMREWALEYFDVPL